MFKNLFSRFSRRNRSTTRPGELGPWTAAALNAMGQACAMGLVIPPSFLPGDQDRNR